MDPDFAAMMGFGSFGKKAPAKKVNTSAKLEQTKRTSELVATSPKPQPVPSEPSPSLVPSTLPTAKISSSENAEPVHKEIKADGIDRPDEKDEDEDNEDDEDDLGPEEQTDFLPISHEITWKDHGKPVSALAIDPAGARVSTGSHDYDVKLYDFGGMTAGLPDNGGYKPFRSFEPAGSYHIHNLSYSSDGSNLLVVTGTSQPQVYSRDGEPGDGKGTQYMKGDPYIRDMKHTSGHVAELTSGWFNPKNNAEFVTSSNDSTVRIWDVENRRKQKVVINVKSKERGARTKVTSCAYSPDGKHIGATGLDGTLHIWSTSGNFARPNMTNETAHIKGSETSSICFSIDGRTVITRGGDDTVKLWDLRSIRQPLFTASNLPNLYAETNVIFSPDDRHILTGVALRPGGEKKSGELVVLGKEGLEEERRVDVGEGSVVRVEWHSRINQIVTASSTGRINVLYSPTASTHGALLPLSKLPRSAPIHLDSITDLTMPQVIITPHSLPMYREENRLLGGGKRKREKERADPVKTRKPAEPMSGPGKGGRVGASATQHLLRGVIKDNTREEDPREALLKYANVAETNPVWAGAWANQPKVFRNIEDEPETEEEHRKRMEASQSSTSKWKSFGGGGNDD
ncbi:Uncharacterized conserved protein, contains WD40 repeat [Phaffia rhodozyma]|uniref:Uncharacterized conserved protein, contains WD40 repeat n=1 Tax=Phaffia rhodozyma TaxID=264483 RepID=A0A0F7SGY4_PHARH|nr:Uncharacterized conserved protein, contains WD40 repeat [Phaffia rhodozyma]